MNANNTKYWLLTATLALVVHQVMAIDAAGLLEEYQANRTEAKKTYDGQEISVSGKVTRTMKEISGMAVTIDDAVTVKLGRSEECKQIILDIEKAQRAENDRVDEAASWEAQYKRKQRQNSGKKGGKNNKNKNSKRYTDSMNPHGIPTENLQLSLSASGICKGIRSSKVYIDKVTTASLSAAGPEKKSAKGKKAAPKKKGGENKEMKEALARKTWTLKGTIYVENGNRYFSPDKGQFGVDVWPITLPAKVGNTALDGKMNNKKAELKVDLRTAARGGNGIKPEKVEKIHSLNTK